MTPQVWIAACVSGRANKDEEKTWVTEFDMWVV